MSLLTGDISVYEKVVRCLRDPRWWGVLQSLMGVGVMAMNHDYELQLFQRRVTVETFVVHPQNS